MVFEQKKKAYLVIIDIGMGNLFSIKNACALSGLDAVITSSPAEIEAADALILPGVGAFPKAMERLQELRLVDPILKFINSNKPFIGICLGMQLLMTESYEFKHCKGLDIIKGTVKRFDNAQTEDHKIKIPHMGWNKICLNKSHKNAQNSLLSNLNDGEYMYFVHSYYVKPEDDKVVLSTTKYGDHDFCSSIKYKNIFACQFHPERSGQKGLMIYRNLAQLLIKEEKEIINVS